MKIVKNSINNLLAFILMFILASIITFSIFEYNLSLKSLNNNLINLNYYESVYNTIIEKVNDFIFIEEVQELYKDYINLSIIKEDINKITKNIYDDKEYKINRYNDFYEIIYKYSNDEDISKKYANEINNIYKENLFPIIPYKIINKLYLKENIQFLIVTILIFISLLIMYTLYIFNKNYKYIIASILGASILINAFNIFIRMFKVFDNFIYTNKSFTNIILKIIYNTFNTLSIIGTSFIILIFMFFPLKKFRSKKRT